MFRYTPFSPVVVDVRSKYSRDGDTLCLNGLRRGAEHLVEGEEEINPSGRVTLAGEVGRPDGEGTIACLHRCQLPVIALALEKEIGVENAHQFLNLFDVDEMA